MFAFIIAFLNPPSVKAWTCADGYSCTNNNQWPGDVWKYDSGAGCWQPPFFPCAGDDSFCGGYSYFRSEEDCQNRENLVTRTCCVEDPGCDPSCGSCDEGTYYSSQPDDYYASGSRSCINSSCNTYTQTCYSPCPTVSACSTNGWINPGNCPSGSTCVSRTITETVPSGCDGTRSCLFVCPEASCTDYNSGASGVQWYDTCPSGDCRSAELSIEIDGEPDDCPHYTNKTCYTDNPPPDNPENVDLALEVRHSSEVELISLAPYSKNNLLYRFIREIKAAGFDTDQVMGYWSNTHSGIIDFGLNNPVGLHAEYSDSDGQEDIVAIYVWWAPTSVSNGSLILPNKLDTTGTLPEQTNSEGNWGFLITRTDYNGTWDKVYVPNLDGSNREWVEAGDIDQNITIYGPDQDAMVQLSGINVRSQGSDEVHLDLLMTFFSNGPDVVSSEEYNLWGLANDYVGFTEFEEDGNIKDSANSNWTDSNEDWALDMEIPAINLFESSDGTEGVANINIDITDDLDLSYVRVDACQTGMISAPAPLVTSFNPNYPLLNCNDSAFMSGLDITSDPNLLELNPTELSANTTNFTDVLGVELNGNDEGALTFWLTVMDKAGNYNQDQIYYELGQWVLVQDGFVYGKQGVSSSTRNLEPNVWDDYAPLSESEINQSEYRFNEEFADLTNQVLLGGNSTTESFLGVLRKYSENSSFKASNFRGVSINSAYNDLIGAYQVKKHNPSYSGLFLEQLGVTNLGSTQSLSDICSGFDPTTDYCIMINDDATSSIDIESGFTCNGRGLIAAKGDVNISPDILNDINSDACIIIAGGDINIGPGTSKSGAPANYDVIKSFMIADGEINIALDGSDNGLIVEGGLVGFDQTTGKSIYINREILWGPRNLYPVLAVNNNSKYGLLSRILFGSQVDIFKTEIGFKPY